jgi:hypothetical protein
MDRLLKDLQRTATLSGRERIAAGGLSMLAPGGIVTGLILGSVLKGKMKNNKAKPVGDLIDAWNYHFFRPRRLEVILAHGHTREDSGTGPIPSLDLPGMTSGLRRRSSGSSSSSSSSSDDHHVRHGNRVSRKIERRADRAQRRADKLFEKAERKGNRRGHSHKGKGKGTHGDDKLYKLIVVGF